MYLSEHCRRMVSIITLFLAVYPCVSAFAIDARVYEGECRETRFFKEKLVRRGPWEKEIQAFADSYAVRAAITEKGTEASILTIDLVAKSAKASIYSDKGFVILMLPSSLRPQQAATKIDFYVADREVKGTSFPQFEAILEDLISAAMPGNSAAWAKRIFKLVGVGEMDISLDGTLFSDSQRHTMVPIAWETQRIDGNWIKASRFVVTVPLSKTAAEAKESLRAHGFGVIMAVHPSTATRRVVFALDRATLGPSPARPSQKPGEAVVPDVARTGRGLDFASSTIVDLLPGKRWTPKAVQDVEDAWYERGLNADLVYLDDDGKASFLGWRRGGLCVSEFSPKIDLSKLRGEDVARYAASEARRRDEVKVREGRRYLVICRDGGTCAVAEVTSLQRDKVSLSYRLFRNIPSLTIRTYRVDVRRLTKGAGYLDLNGLQYETQDIGTVFSYSGWFKGKPFKMTHRENDRPIMRIGPELRAGDGVIEGFIVEHIEEGKPVAHIFVDEDWRKTLPQTRI